MEQAGNTVVPLRSSLPEKCYSTLLDTGAVVILKRGETGYYKTDIPYSTKEEARELVGEYNRKLGVTKAQEEAMRIVVYRQQDGSTIPLDFVQNLDPSPQGFEIIDAPTAEPMLQEQEPPEPDAPSADRFHDQQITGALRRGHRRNSPVLC